MASLCEAFRSRRLKKAVQGLVGDGEDGVASINPRQSMQFLTTMSRIDAANQLLTERGLITLTGQDLYPQVGLTQSGYDLGREYSNWFLRLGLWGSEYRSHCLIAMLIAIGAIIAERLMNRLLR